MLFYLPRFFTKSMPFYCSTDITRTEEASLKEQSNCLPLIIKMLQRGRDLRMKTLLMDFDDHTFLKYSFYSIRFISAHLFQPIPVK